MQVARYIKSRLRPFAYTCIIIFLIFILNDLIISISTPVKRTQKRKFRSKMPPMKYILIWTDPKGTPLNELLTDHFAFVNNDCEYFNCFVTNDSNHLKDIKRFNAVVFNGKELYNLSLPKERSRKQKYVYVNDESSEYSPVCSKKFNNFFNWTFTYRLDSDLVLPYFNIYNNAGDKVAPSKTVKWITDDFNIEIMTKLKERLNEKTKAAAWFVSNCKTKSKREKYVSDLRKSLQEYNLDVDIYGACGDLECPWEESEGCNKKMAKDYYFYLSFENSLVQDYVTEKVLRPLEYDTVPVVYGGANYSRFLPPGSYLNAMELSPKVMAKTMHKIISDTTKQSYYNFFKWRKYYDVNLREKRNEKLCDLCALMNNRKKVKSHTTIQNFVKWWNQNRDVSDECNAILKNGLYG